jgi:vancomycin resistance protein YoaR
LISFLVLAAVTIGIIGVCCWNQAWQDRIYPSVRIEGIGLGGLTEQEAAQRLGLVADEFLAAPVTLVLGEHSRQVSRSDLGFKTDPGANAHLAYMVGRSGPLWRRGWELWQAFHADNDIPLMATLDSDQARSVLQNFAANLYSPPQNARLVVDNSNKIRVVPGKPGQTIDLDAAMAVLEKEIHPFAGRLELHLAYLQPQVSTQDVLNMKVNGTLASYTTYYDVSNVSRTYNVNVAADALDNCLVKPGATFSFNQIVGPRSQEAGYKEALIIEQDKFTPGIGGGVCQVSSTLYNAVLLAGLEIVERSNHALPVAYVPLGRDATVAYGVCDLRFRNNTGGYLYIKTRVGGGALTITVLGDTAEKKHVELDSVVDKVLDFQVVTKDDPSLEKGKRVVETAGVKGYQVRAFRVIDGVRTLLSQDVYKPVDEVVRIGTMPAPVTPAPSGAQPAAATTQQQPAATAQQPSAAAQQPPTTTAQQPPAAAGTQQPPATN